MPKGQIWLRYFRFFGPDAKADVRDELQFHIDSKIAELMDEGWAAERASVEARRQFGDIASVRQTCELLAKDKEKRMRKAEYLSAGLQDIKFGALQLKHGFGTAAFALIALGVGMGIATAVFSIVYAVVLQPLPFPSPRQLVTIWSTRQGVDDVVTPRNFDAWRRDAKSFRALGALQPTTFALAHAGATTQISGGFASAGYFKLFGVSAELGRTFTPEEDKSPRLHLAVIGDQLWRTRLGGDPEILGRPVYLNREPFTVVGVMPASFSVQPDDAQIWVPLALSESEMGWTGGILKVVGRLQPGITLPQAQAEMNVLARNLEVQYPEMNRDRGIRVGDFARELVGNYRERLFILLGAVGFVLLIAGANVANLLLARSAGRSQELAIRAALGASRVRIVRQLLTESLLIGILGAVTGLALASVLLEMVGKLGLDAVPRLNQASLNFPVFLFASVLVVATTLFSGLLPALRAAQVDIQAVLRRGGRGAGVAHDPARQFYIAGEVALALVLLVSAGLLIRTAVAAAHTQLGFVPKHLITGRTALSSTVYRSSAEVVNAYQHILRDLRDEPGVVSAAFTSKAPLTTGRAGLSIQQNSVAPPMKQDVAAELRYISDGYFATMQIPLLKGREFNIHDGPGSAQVVLVNENLARRIWPNMNAIGQTIRIPEMEGRSSEWQVIGVTANVRSNGPMSEAPPVIYFPFTQVATNPWHWVEQSLYLVARTRADSVNALPLLAHALANTDPQLPLGDVRTMEQRMARTVEISRFYTLVLAILGVCGLLLTMAGIYGVVSYFVNRRRADIGIRLALGSSRTGILLLVVRQGMRPVVAGTVIGLAGALAASHILASQLYGVRATDPVTLLAATFLLLMVATFACYIPGRQAARVDPMVTLRDG